jgi:spermidine/putrescine transport system ATP-binding protein
LGEYSVEIRELVKWHGRTPAVDHCSFSIRQGEFFSILGPSGSGKTTTLRLLAGFEHPDHGEILIEGRSMRGVPPNRRPVNLVFQHYALFPHLTVFRNVSFGLEMRKVPKHEIEHQVRAALDMVQLQNKYDRFPSQLSGGEQQRVAVARALVNRPAVVLLDEPLGALDQRLRQSMQVELKGIQERAGSTFVSVTHNQEEALTMSDRVAVMDRGRILQIGTPQELYESPASVFVAEFIGMSNSMSGLLVSSDQPHCRVRVEGFREVIVRRRVAVPEGRPVTVLVRPERVSLDHPPEDGCENVCPARVDKVIYNGSDLLYWLMLSETVLWKARVPNAGDDHKRFRAGEQVSVHWRAADGVVLTE